LQLTYVSNAILPLLESEATLSNWADASFRRKTTPVAWADISGAPDYDICNNNLAVGGAVLGAAGLALSGLKLLNGGDQLVSAL
jgi:hypothetical protein